VTQEPVDPDYPTSSTYPEYYREEPPQPPAPEQKVSVRMPFSRPYVTYTLLALNIIIFLLQAAGEFWFGFDVIAGLGLKVNELIRQGQYWRLFTPMFLHGSILHLGFNMYALYIFGPGLERYYRHGRFLLLFLLGGFAGNVFSFMFSASPSLGSSTAIFGLLGAEGVFLYHNQKVFGGVARRALTNIIIIALVNFMIGLSPGIDNWGHMGGLIGGTIFAWLGGPLLEVRGISPDLRVEDIRETRDVILATVIDLSFFGFLAFGTIFLWGN
jgi:rhomboid protease GluP